MTAQAMLTETPRAVLGRLRTGERLYATTTETATILRYDRRTIIDGINAGQIPAIRVGTSWRVPVSWITGRPGIPGADGGGGNGLAA